MTDRLDGRIAVITGAGSGMGRESALKMAAEGAHVYVLDINGPAAEAVTAEIGTAGGTATAVTIDVTDRDQFQALFEGIEKDHGVLHVLYLNAGVEGPAGVDISDNDWDLTMGVNVRSLFYATHFALPLLRKAEGHGSIIVTASSAGVKGSSVGILYSATKGAAISFVRSLAIATGPEGIRVNAILPGSTDTPLLRKFFERTGKKSDTEVNELLDNVIKTTVPMGRRAQASEIADAAVWLASDESSFVSGASIAVDGGYLVK